MASEENNFQFIPSFKSTEAQLLDRYKHLMFLHIPRSGGTSFQHPIAGLKLLLSKFSKRKFNPANIRKYLCSGNQIHGSIEASAVKNLITSESVDGLVSAHLGYHGPNWSLLHDHINKIMGYEIKVIATVRDHRERLRSQIEKDAKSRASENFILEKIKSRHSDYDNSCHKWIYDYGIKDALDLCLNEMKGQKVLLKKKINDPHYINVFEFLDVSNNDSIRRVKSEYLSASMLPNILKYSRLNSFRDKRCSLDSKFIENAMNLCLDMGFLENDSKLDLQYLTKKSSKYLSLIADAKMNFHDIHPLTYLIGNDIRSGSIVSTADFIKDPVSLIRKSGIFT